MLQVQMSLLVGLNLTWLQVLAVRNTYNEVLSTRMKFEPVLIVLMDNGDF